ncbi:MAG: Na(+)/H(+) antiporter subunit B [Opitutales bacterium]
MTLLQAVIDVVILVTMLSLAVGVLAIQDLFKSVIAFIALGLFMALAWVRLEAPDVALAEAAVGAGITGVLLLDAVRHMRHRKAPEEDERRG